MMEVLLCSIALRVGMNVRDVLHGGAHFQSRQLETASKNHYFQITRRIKDCTVEWSFALGM